MERAPFPDPRRPFRWDDGERTIHFGRDALRAGEERLGAGYALLTTARAEAAAPSLAARAATGHHVPAGRVDEIAAALRGEVRGERLVALGGGRVIDVAKALAAADPPRSVAAVPTTLSGAEMTRVHRHAADVASATPRVRPSLVITDPGLAASQPEPELAASALNALGHAVEGPATLRASPVPALAGLEGARLLADGLDSGPEPDRDALALGALLAAYAIDAAGYGIHHVLSQTLVRLAGAGHGAVNAVLLPHTIGALARRAPDAIARLDAALGGDASARAASLRQRAGAARLRDIGVPADLLPAAAEAAAARPELDLTPPRAARDELLGLYEAAW